MIPRVAVWLFAGQLCAGVMPAFADTALPVGVRDVGFDQHLGATVDPALSLRDETGAPVRLGDFLGARPVLLVPAYYGCPMLCSLVVGGLVSALRTLSFDAGREFDVVVVSFDPHDTAEQAAAKKAAVLADYRRTDAARGWHFLTGDEPALRALMTTIGFRYSWDAAHGQYAHAAGLVVLTPAGQIARYAFGVEFAPRDLRLALVEATAGHLGSVIDQILLFCFHYDPATGRYSQVALNAVRAGGVVTMALLAAFVAAAVRRERHAPPPLGGA
jgi:protein SCO1/2